MKGDLDMFMSTQSRERLSMNRHQYPERMISQLMNVGLKCLFCLLISGCSIMLDPSVCSTDADCNGGVCQVGVCIGSIQETDIEVPLAGEIAGEEVDLGDDMMSAGIMNFDMETAGEALAGEPMMDLDMAVNDIFVCDIVAASLTRAGAHLRDLPPEIDGSTHWLTSEESLSVEVTFATPNDEIWRSNLHFYLGEEEVSITENDQIWTANILLPEEGEYRVRLVVGATDDVRCVDQFFLTVDRSEPELSLISPASSEIWIGQLSEVAQTSISIEARDLTRVQFSILDSTDTEVAQRDFSDETLWSTELGLREGVNLFTVIAKDELMQETNQEVTLHYDPYTPGIGLTEPASNRVTIESSTLPISGFVYQRTGLGGVGGEGGVEVDARVIITTYQGSDRNGEEINRTLTRSDSSGAFALFTPINIGTNFIEICAYDRAENTYCTNVIVTRVESQPCVNITSAAYTSSDTYTLSGNVCPSVSLLSMSVDGHDLQPLNILSDDTFSETLILEVAGVSVPLSLIAQAEDGQTASANLEVMWDDTPPIVIISSPNDNDCFNGEVVELCGRIVDPESGTVSVNLNQSPLDLSDQFVEGEQWWEGFCTEVDLNIPRGQAFNEQTLTLSGSNGSGHFTEVSVTITADQEPPSITFDDPVFEDWYQPTALGRIELSGVITSTGCALTSQMPIQMSLLSNENGTLILEGDGRFTYRTVLNDGTYQLNSILRDRAGNEAEIAYDFNVDSQGPILDLIVPEVRQVSNQSTLAITIEGEDIGSGLLNTSGRVSGDFGEAPLTATLLDGLGQRYELSMALELPPGEHPLTITVSDRVGNLSDLAINYIRDIIPPTATIVSPSVNEPLPLRDQVILEVIDNLSEVTEVSVNGVLASRNGDLWIAYAVDIDPSNPRLEIEAHDEANNQLSDGTGQTLFPVTLGALSWQDPGRLGFPHRGYIQANGSRSPDSAVGLKALASVMWSADFSPNAELLTLYHTSPDVDPTPLSGVSDNGGTSFTVEFDQTISSPQPLFPSSASIVDTQRASIQGVLTLFTLSDEEGVTPFVRLWQRYSEVLASTDLPNDPLAAPETWVEVRLGLPPTLNAHTITVGDVNGDGRLDLITISSTGVFLFRQNAEGEFIFDGNTGLDIRGLGTLSTAAEHLWWVDLNGDERLDLIEQTNTSTNAWLTELEAGSYQYTAIIDFPSISSNRKVDGWLNIDWDQDGTIDPIAWSNGRGLQNSLLRRYTLSNSVWSTVVITDETTLPQTLVDVLWTDLDADQDLELLCVGTQSMVAIESGIGSFDANLPDLPIIDGELPQTTAVTLADIDRDGDDDWLFSFTETSPTESLDAGSDRGALWGLNSSPTLISTEVNPIRILVKRQNAESHDGLGAFIRIARNNDFNFDEIYPVRPFNETIIYTRGQGTVNVQVVFSDHSIQNDHIITEFNVDHGSQLTVVDPQE